MARSISFNRLADRDDALRGGLERGRDAAEVLARHLAPGARIVEVGVGTGAVATALADRGLAVAGVDVAEEMLDRAHARLGAMVVRADGAAVPLRTGAVDNVYLVWVLHLVADPADVVTECARLLRPGGRFVAVAVDPQTDDDIQQAWVGMESLRVRIDTPEAVVGWADAAGFTLVGRDHFAWHTDESPAEYAKQIEDRSFSCLWNVDDATWASVVQPAIDGLRALPEPDRRRHRVARYPVTVFERRG
ncbi:MAG: class I SAM-dependent methyltransferase [Acidimicrobiia bacterium]